MRSWCIQLRHCKDFGCETTWIFSESIQALNTGNRLITAPQDLPPPLPCKSRRVCCPGKARMAHSNRLPVTLGLRGGRCPPFGASIASGPRSPNRYSLPAQFESPPKSSAGGSVNQRDFIRRFSRPKIRLEPIVPCSEITTCSDSITVDGEWTDTSSSLLPVLSTS
jgi:hypothetical protein